MSTWCSFIFCKNDCKFSFLHYIILVWIQEGWSYCFSVYPIVLSFYLTPGCRIIMIYSLLSSFSWKCSVFLYQALTTLWKSQSPRWQHWIPNGLCLWKRKMGEQSCIIQNLSNLAHLSGRLSANNNKTLWHLPGEMIQLFIEQLSSRVRHWTAVLTSDSKTQNEQEYAIIFPCRLSVYQKEIVFVPPHPP